MPCSSINFSENANLERLFPWVGVAINEHMIRNLSKTWGEIAGATTKAIASQEKSLHSLVLVLDFLLTISYWTGGVCSVVISPVVLGENTSRKIKTELDKIWAQANSYIECPLTPYGSLISSADCPPVLPPGSDLFSELNLIFCLLL